MSKLNQYTYYIETLMSNRGIDCESGEWKTNDAFADFVHGKRYVTSSFDIELETREQDLLIFVNAVPIFADEDFDSKLRNAIKTALENLKLQKDFDLSYCKTVSFLFFVSNVETRVRLGEKFTVKACKELLRYVTDSKKVLARTRAIPSFYVIKESIGQELKISHVARHDILRLPLSDVAELSTAVKKKPLRGYVFTAKLIEIVNLYNIVGDRIFRKNVRLGIEDTLEVDRSIKETLRDNPDEFWFHNNGITILAEEPIVLNHANAIVLKRADQDDLNFSIINGAQTVTAASEFFYSAENSKKTDAKDAEVLVKIIEIDYADEDKSADTAKQISISLNRQKPIKAEDIAYTNTFVEKMNAYLTDHGEQYIITRRGEEKNIPGRIDCSLVSFARAAKACAGDPGSARTSSANKLLDVDRDAGEFKDTKLFVPEWYTADEEELEVLFDKYYKPVSSALNLARIYPSAMKKIKRFDSASEGIVAKNGMWYFIAYVIYLCNRESHLDYTEFIYPEDKLTVDAVAELIPEFAKLVLRNVDLQKTEVNSNLFKKSELYETLLKSRSDIGFSEYFHLITDEYTPLEEVFGKLYKKHICSHLLQAPVEFDTAADAFVYMVDCCFSGTIPSEYDIRKTVNEMSFLTFDGSKRSSYFANASRIVVNGRIIYVGRASSTSEKIRQLERLVKHLHYPKNTLLWMCEGETLFAH